MPLEDLVIKRRVQDGTKQGVVPGNRWSTDTLLLKSVSPGAHSRRRKLAQHRATQSGSDVVAQVSRVQLPSSVLKVALSDPGLRVLLHGYPAGVRIDPIPTTNVRLDIDETRLGRRLRLICLVIRPQDPVRTRTRTAGGPMPGSRTENASRRIRLASAPSSPLTTPVNR